MPLTAADIMTTPVVTAKPDDSIATVARLLSEHEISAVPVCNKDGTVVGMISEGDLISPFGAAINDKRARWLNLLSEGDDLAPSFLEFIKVENRKISDLMKTEVITASPETTVHQLADLLVSHRIKRLPVLQGGKLIGIVSRADIVNALARSPEGVVDSL